jgi:hypothetical protein
VEEGEAGSGEGDKERGWMGGEEEVDWVAAVSVD